MPDVEQPVGHVERDLLRAQDPHLDHPRVVDGGPVVDLGGSDHAQVGGGEQLQGGPLERPLGEDQPQHQRRPPENPTRASPRAAATSASTADGLQGGQRRLPALVAVVGLRAHQGLVDRVGGEDAEDDRDAGVELDPLEPGGTFAGHEVVVTGVAPDHRPEADHRIDPFRLGQPLGDHRQLEGTRHPGHHGRAQVGAGLLQGVEGPGQQAVGDPAVELGAGEGDPPAGVGPARHPVDGDPHPGGVALFGPVGQQGQFRGRHRGPRGGGPSAPAWSAGTRCSPASESIGCSPARRYRGRSPRDRRTWSGCWS